MTRSSIYEDEQYEIYEAHYERQTGLTGTNVAITAEVPHADVISAVAAGACLRTVVYVNGVSDVVTEVAINVADIDITITSTLVASDVVDIYICLATGTLPSNAATGKLTLPELQNMQAYGATGNQIARPGCGTKQKETIIFSAEGTITLGLDRRGNTALADFAEAMDEDTYLLIAVKDTTEGSAGADVTYDLLREVRVPGYGRSPQAVETERGIVTDTVTFAFQPPVKFIVGV